MSIPDTNDRRQPGKSASDEARPPTGEAGSPAAADGDAAPEPAVAALGTGASRTGHPTEKVGLVIDGRYKIIELIGRGGMGSVYRAEHVGIGRQVALKLLHPTLVQNPDVVRRFEREAAAVGRIEHPNCVDVSDFGRLEDGSLYLVMEYLEGKSLGDVLAEETRVPIDRALRITRHVVRGLGHAHKAGIVHRDIKPENVLLCQVGDDPDFAKILDFGIAKLIGHQADEGVKLTQAGVAFGTPVYMSPEQAVGNPVDGRADLYGATVVLFEMITGRPPFFSEDRLEVLSMHTTRPVPILAERAPELSIPADVEQLIMRGLAKRPDERYADADEYLAAIDVVLAGMAGTEMPRPPPLARSLPRRHQTAPVVYGGESGPQPLAAPAPPPPRRRLLLGLALALVATAIAIVAVLLPGGESKPAEPPPRVVPAAPPSMAGQAEEVLADGKPLEAIEMLERSPTVADDAAAQRVLAHAYAATGRNRDAIRAYARALELEPGAAPDPTMATNLLVMLDAKNGDVALDAADLLLAKLSSGEAAAKLSDIASREDDPDLRHKAMALAEKHGIGDRIDRVASYSLDLIQGEHCPDRQKAVFQLRTLGDKRAIPALRKARVRSSKDPRYKGMNVNQCLKRDADAAIAVLERDGH